MVRNFLNYINGQWVAGSSTQTFENRNPSKQEEILGIFPRANQADVDQAVKSVASAFESWSKLPAPQRAAYLFKAAELLNQKKEEIATAIMKEMGKSWLASLGDIQSAIDMCYFAAGEGRRLAGATPQSALKDRWALTRRLPVGVCALITPWNAPAASIAWKLFPALICGNTVIVKPASDTPLTANLIFEVLDQIGLPAGVANLIHGYGEEVGLALVNHPGVDLISFTGSSAVGRRLNEIGAKRLIKVSLEMGGKNGVLVLNDADLEAAAAAVIQGAFSLAGQRCAATSRLIVQSKIYQQFLDKLIEKTKQVKVGPPTNQANLVTPIINQQQLQKIVNYVALGKQEGAKLLLGGEILTTGEYEQGCYFSPTIFEQVTPLMKIFQEEIFGPVLTVTKFENLEEGINLINATNYGLVASVFTQNATLGLKVIEQLRTGVGYLNAPTFGSEVHLPFGGFKLSGNGHREAGSGGIDVFSEWQTVYLDFSGTVQNSQTGHKPTPTTQTGR